MGRSSQPTDLQMRPVRRVHEDYQMTIPPELQDRLIEVLRIAHDNALEAHQEAQVRYKGYKQHRIDALGAEALETELVLGEVLMLKGNQA
jgi:hypothetical protein